MAERHGHGEDERLRGKGLELAGGSAFPMTVREALLDIDLNALVEGEAIDAAVSAGFSSVVMAPASRSSAWWSGRWPRRFPACAGSS